ncbi:MAG TPA: hypothetical protein DIT07_05070 [Sphingobacteriaceae bacterium]|nr:hypothetical protein [Sphingobacteriaceae bacterium]
MEGEEIKQQINTWFDEKLKNPYFGAVAAVWIVSNRIVFFSLFNFDVDLSLQERIDFIHKHLQSYTFLWFTGFYATIAWAFVWGIVVMLVADQVNTFGKVLYKFCHRSKNFLLQKIEPSKWMETRDHFEIEQKNIQFEKEVKTQRLELNKVEKDHGEVQKLYAESLKSIIEKDSLISSKDQTLKLLEDQVRQYTEENNRFRVLYARYGKYDKFVEVTKTVSDLIQSKGSVLVSNADFGIDPNPCKIKELVVEYEIDSESKSLTANEGDIIEAINNQLAVSGTPKSIEGSKWLENQEKLASLMSGNWELEWIKDGKSHLEYLTVDAQGNYFIAGIHAFNLVVTEFNSDRIIINKHRLSGELKSVETLSYRDSNLIGTDSEGYNLIYKKIVEL